MNFYNRIKYCSILGLIMISYLGYSQKNFSNFTTKKIPVLDSVQIDSLSIIPGSFYINMDSSYYRINYFKGYILFKQKNTDSIFVRYKSYPLNFTSTVQNRSLKNQNENGRKKILTKNPYYYTPKTLNREDLFGSNSLQKSGSISRGINIGNTRDLSVNSNMNLKLAGTFQGIEILASVTDNNIPIQPQGNTQTLQDFDKVFIQFSKDDHRLIAGDFQTKESNDVFLKFNKKAQGISYSGKYTSKLFKKSAVLSTKSDVALSRGKFNRQSILGIEGNQGPYQLFGAENERFIIILSGTERVYIDGKLLSRGMDGDYVIDYNSAEITFTTNQIITKDKRIIVEFQYSDQNYGRSLFTSRNEISNQKGKFFINFYTEQDMKFQQLNQSLSNDQIQLLSDVGDSLQFAVSPRIDTVEYNSNQILYKKSDTIIDSINYTYYQYSNNPDSAIYSLGFSNVGQGNGNYTLSSSNINGRVYEWIPPLNGTMQGSYEPINQLIAPKQNQMLTIGSSYKHKNSTFFFESAFSKRNQNLFSKKHKKDNQGIALKTTLKNQKIKKLNEENTKESPKTRIFNTEFSYQLINKNFRSIERFRSVEFNRDFNLSSSTPQNTEQILSLKWNKIYLNKRVFGIDLSYINRQNEYYGFKSAVDLNSKIGKKGTLNGKGSYLQSEGNTQKSQFLRHLVTYKYRLNNSISLKIWEEEEYNLVNNSNVDTLESNSFRYTVYGSELNLKKSNSINLSFNGNQRIDYLPLNNVMNKVTTANNAGTKFIYLNKKGTKFLWNSVFRELSIDNNDLVNEKPENTLLNRFDYKFKLLKGLINSSSFFETASGSEIKRQFQFVEVNPGQGNYAWIDFNNDSIQDFTEFVVSDFQDQNNYIKVSLPTSDLIKTYNNEFNQSLNINPARYLKRDKKINKLITRFNNQFLMKLNTKTSKSQKKRIQIPFQNGINDTNLISTSSSIRNTIYFNRSNPIIGMNYTVRTNQNKTLLISGFEGRSLTSNSIDLRWNIAKKFTFRNKVELITKSRLSELSEDNNYEIKSYVVEPKFTYQKGSSFRSSIVTAFKDKTNNNVFGGGKAEFKKIGIEITYNLISKGRMTLGTDYISTVFDGSQANNSPLLFELLEGFQIGTNYTWRASYQRSFKNNFQISLNYEGRNSETIKAVHTGNMQVQLLF